MLIMFYNDKKLLSASKKIITITLVSIKYIVLAERFPLIYLKQVNIHKASVITYKYPENIF